MALVLTVDEAAWRHHVGELARRLGDRLVPVVKGNGYGFGRALLTEVVEAHDLSEVAVGTVDELLVTNLRQHVLTPSLDDHLDSVSSSTVLTVGSLAHADAATHGGPIAVKLKSSMQRYGVEPSELGALLDHLASTDREPERFVLHLPLAGTDDDRVAELEGWLRVLPAGVPLSVSHLGPDRFEALADRHPDRRWQLRLGTALWHGDKSAFHLGAEVLEVRPVRRGTRAGYRLAEVPEDGHLAMVGAGSAQGVTELPGGLSPFHHARHRLALFEPPHMHTSMAFVPTGQKCPSVGEVVDVQRPLTRVAPDRLVWIR